MRRLLTVPLAAVLLAGGAGTAAGQDGMTRASRFELGVYAGGSLTSSWFESRTVTLNGTANPVENDDATSYQTGYAPVFGANVAWFFTPVLGLRLHGAYLPMQPPRLSDGFFDAFEGAGERRTRVLNTYVYDLNLVARPFIRGGGWYRTAYLFAGGGGLTVDAQGEDRRQCVPYLVPLGACLSYQPGDATVAQGTAGAGIDLLSLGGALGIFGEVAAHVYDSPVHVGDSWLGPLSGGPGARLRVADDRVAVTPRVVIGLKAMLGNLLPPPPAPMVDLPPPPMTPEPPPAPPAAPAMQEMQVCVVADGALTSVAVQYDPATGDTMVAGTRFRDRYPATTGYAASATWFVNGEPISFGAPARRYVKYGLPRVLGVSEVARIGEYQGVPVFAEGASGARPEVIYLPLRPGCEFQPYQVETKAAGVRG